MSNEEDFSQSRFMLMLGKFGVPIESEFEESDEDNLMGFYGSLDEAKADAATSDPCENYGWHIIDTQTGHIHTDDGNIITDPPKWNRHTGYEKQPKVV